jgi:hypothetical protein
MTGEDQRGLAVILELGKQFVGPLRNFDAAFLRAIDVVIPDMVEMGELGADAAEIVPDTGQDLLDLLRGFFREGGFKIFAADPVFAQPWTDKSQGAAEPVRGLERVEEAGGAQHPDRQRTHGGIAERLGRVAEAKLGAKDQITHRNQMAGR